MANTKISNLPAAASLTGSDLMPVVQGGVTKKGTFDQIPFLQAGTGAVARTAQAKMRDVVSVKDFGAVGDGVADDTAAIQAAANYANSIGGTLYADSGTYKITATVTITCNCDMSAARFNVNAASVPIGIIAGSTTQEIRGRVMFLPRITNTAKTTTGWAGFDSSVGIDLANLFMSQVTVPSVLKFGIGIDVGGYTQGNAYNNIFLGEMFDNKISLRLRKKGVSGYSNQNTFYGGQYGMSGAEGTAITGSYAVSLEATTNNNTFVNPSLEANGNQFQVSFDDSSFNTFVNPRFEITGGGRVNFNSSYTGGSQQNTIIGGYNFAYPVVTYTGSASTLNRIIGDKEGDTVSFGSRGLAILNQNGNGPTQPILTGFQATATNIANFLAIDPRTTSLYGFKLYSEGIIGKRSTDTYDRIKLDWSAPGKLFFGEGSAALSQYIGYYAPGVLQVGGMTNFIPGADNTTTNGTAAFRWSVVYAATGTINTSDERAKQDIAALDAAEKRVAVALKGMVKKFRFKDAVQAKGDAARIHVGVIAQEVIAAFSAEGLDPMRYGIVCYDQWDAEGDRPAGDRYGVRYEELLAFIIAAL